MRKSDRPSARPLERKKGGGLAPALCNVLGTGILLIVIALCLPLCVPAFTEYEVYNVVSGSMEPEMPIGSLALVEPIEPTAVREGDVIAFHSGESVITHRVTQNHTFEGEFVTKGDANEEEDMRAIPYEALIGQVIWHIPMVGGILALLTGTVGKLYLLAFAFCGVMFNMLAGRIRARREEE